MGNATLDTVEINQTSETPWAYPDNIVIQQLLARHVGTVGNAVLQSSALTVLTKSIGFTTDTRADYETLLADRYAGTQVVYIDPDGEAAFVIITSLSGNRDGRNLWQLSATLVQPPAASSGS